MRFGAVMMRARIALFAIDLALALTRCSTPPLPEIEVGIPPRIPPSPQAGLFERKITGQVFWITEGGDTDFFLSIIVILNKGALFFLYPAG